MGKSISNNWEELYKTSLIGPLLCCLSKDEGNDQLNLTHVGACGGHIGARALAAKVCRQGFSWPYIIDDAAKLVSRAKSSHQIFKLHYNQLSSAHPHGQCKDGELT
jgi:hypothetical protein